MIRTALLLLAGVLASSAPSQSKPVRIVPIGDSITQGRKGGGTNKPCFSWRYPFWKKLVDLGAAFDLVGSEKGGFEGDPEWADYKGKAFDRDHEGHWGWKTGDVRAKLGGWLEGYTPDVALIQLGTNDGKAVPLEQTVGEMRKIVELLRGKNAKVTVLLGQCFHAWDPFPAMRKAMGDLAKELSTKASPVEIVDLSPGWVSDPDAAGSHTVDWVHPNAAGDERLAEFWMKALQPHLKRLGAVK